MIPTICQTMLSHYLPLMFAAYCAFGILHQNRGKSYGYNVALTVDLWLCALIFRDPDITISSMTRLYMMRAKPPYWARGLNGFLNLLQPGHCEIARLSDIARAQGAIVILNAQEPP